MDHGEGKLSVLVLLPRGTYPPVFRLPALTPRQLDEYETVLANALDVLRTVDVRLRLFMAGNEYVLSGGESEEGLRQAIMNSFRLK